MQNHDRERQEEVVEAAELWRLQETSARQKGTEERIKQCLQDNMKSWATPCEEATVREMRGVKREKENKLRIIHKQNRRQPTAHWYCKGATPTSSLQRPPPANPPRPCLFSLNTAKRSLHWPQHVKMWFKKQKLWGILKVKHQILRFFFCCCTSCTDVSH